MPKFVVFDNKYLTERRRDPKNKNGIYKNELMPRIKNPINKEMPKANNEIEDLKHLVKKKKIQNDALQKIIENLNKSDIKNNC